MTGHVKVSGTWRDISEAHVKVAGTWKQAELWCKVSGTWKQIITAAPSPITVSGSMDGTGTGSNTVTGTQRIVNVPAGNSGIIVMKNVSETLGNLQISVNGAAYQDLAENSEFTFTNGQNIRFRGTLLAPGESVYGEVWDKDTNTIVASFGAVTISRGAS